MTREAFDQIVIFLEGFYERKFSENALAVAWGIFSPLDDHLVGMGARRMAEAGEEAPSPQKWLKYVKEVQAEEAARAKVQETQERLDRLRLSGPASPAVSQEAIKAVLEQSEKTHPRYPGMGLNQILAVRELEEKGVAHEEALRLVNEKTAAGKT